MYTVSMSTQIAETFESPLTRSWFTKHSTFVSRSETPQWETRYSPKCVEIVWSSRFRSVHVRNLLPYLPAGNSVRMVGQQLMVAHNAAIIHKALAERELFHPTRYGLEPRRVTGLYDTVIRESGDLFDSWDENFCKNVVPYEEMPGRCGWFPKNVNSSEVGTPYVYASLRPGREPGSLPKTVWVFTRVGHEEKETRVVYWDDSVAISDAAQRLSGTLV